MQDIILTTIFLIIFTILYFAFVKKRLEQEKRMLNKEEKFYDLIINKLEKED